MNLFSCFLNAWYLFIRDLFDLFWMSKCVCVWCMSAFTNGMCSMGLVFMYFSLFQASRRSFLSVMEHESWRSFNKLMGFLFTWYLCKSYKTKYICSRFRSILVVLLFPSVLILRCSQKVCINFR